MLAELLFVLGLSTSPTALTGGVPPPPPPPPPAEKPKITAAPIRVGGSVQVIAIGPGARWLNGLPAAVLLQRAEAVAKNPDDVCARGDLVSHGRNSPESILAARYDHLLWMIGNHPEWDGFYLTGRLFESPASEAERARFGEIRQAWLQAVDREPRRAIVLHNAAMFFAVQEPYRSIALLKAAMEIEPGEPLFHRGLGKVYGYSQTDARYVQREFDPDQHSTLAESATFAQHAREQLWDSDDIDLLRGALDLFGPWGLPRTPFIKELGERPESLLRERNYLEDAVPSRSRYTQGACEAPWPPRH